MISFSTKFNFDNGAYSSLEILDNRQLLEVNGAGLKFTFVKQFLNSLYKRHKAKSLACRVFMFTNAAQVFITRNSPAINIFVCFHVKKHNIVVLLGVM